MALEQQQIVDILNAEGDTETKARKLLGIFSDDTSAQLNAVLVNKEQVITEKREEVAKRKALEEQLLEAKEANSKLQKQLETSSPDEIKKIYEKQMGEALSVYEKKTADQNTLISQQKEVISRLEHEQLKFECMQEFQKAISSKNIASDSVMEFAEYVLGPDCYKFDHRSIGEGKTILATKDGMTIESAVKAALETSFGKKCVVVQSSGGGAGGGVSGRTADILINPFKKGNENLTEQIRLYRTNPELYRQLKAQAES